MPQSFPLILLTFIAAAQALAPVLVELNKTHATNALWPAHARFHLVWQVFSHVLSSALVITLLWWSDSCTPERFHMAALILAAPMRAFLVAVIARRLYRGALHDANGVMPLPLKIAGKRFQLEMNLVLVLVGTSLLLMAVYSFDMKR